MNKYKTIDLTIPAIALLIFILFCSCSTYRPSNGCAQRGWLTGQGNYNTAKFKH